MLGERWNLGVQGPVARLRGYFSMSHHQENLDETSDAGSCLGMTDIPFDRAEMEDGISLRPAECVADTSDLDRITDPGFTETDCEFSDTQVIGTRALTYFQFHGLRYMTHLLASPR